LYIHLEATDFPEKKFSAWLAKFFPEAELVWPEEGLADLPNAIKFPSLHSVGAFASAMLPAQSSRLRCFGCEIVLTTPVLTPPTLAQIGDDEADFFPPRWPFSITKVTCWPELLPSSVWDDSQVKVFGPGGDRFDFPIGKTFVILIPKDGFVVAHRELLEAFPSVQLTPGDTFPERCALPLPAFDPALSYYLVYAKRLIMKVPDSAPPAANLAHYLALVATVTLPHPLGRQAQLFPRDPVCRLLSFHSSVQAAIWAGNCLSMLLTLSRLTPENRGVVSASTLVSGDAPLYVWNGGDTPVLPQEDMITIMAETSFTDVVWAPIPSFEAAFPNPAAARLFRDWGREFGIYPEAAFSNFRPEPSDDMDTDLLPDPLVPSAGIVTLPTIDVLYIVVSPTYAEAERGEATPATLESSGVPSLSPLLISSPPRDGPSSPEEASRPWMDVLPGRSSSRDALKPSHYKIFHVLARKALAT
jgi:hypothetical protein